MRVSSAFSIKKWFEEKKVWGKEVISIDHINYRLSCTAVLPPAQCILSLYILLLKLKASDWKCWSFHKDTWPAITFSHHTTCTYCITSHQKVASGYCTGRGGWGSISRFKSKLFKLIYLIRGMYSVVMWTLEQLYTTLSGVLELDLWQGHCSPQHCSEVWVSWGD